MKEKFPKTYSHNCIVSILLHCLAILMILVSDHSCYVALIHLHVLFLPLAWRWCSSEKHHFNWLCIPSVGAILPPHNQSVSALRKLLLWATGSICISGPMKLLGSWRVPMDGATETLQPFQCFARATRYSCTCGDATGSKGAALPVLLNYRTHNYIWYTMHSSDERQLCQHSAQPWQHCIHNCFSMLLLVRIKLIVETHALLCLQRPHLSQSSSLSSVQEEAAAVPAAHRQLCVRTLCGTVGYIRGPAISL